MTPLAPYRRSAGWAAVIALASLALLPAAASARGHHWWQPSTNEPTEPAENGAPADGSTDDPATDGAGSWSGGAGWGWNGSAATTAPSTTLPNTTWNQQDVAKIDVRELNVERPAISPNGDGEGDVVDVTLRLRRSSAAVRVLVLDAAGNVVRDLGTISRTSRYETRAWDGTNTAGAAVADGAYRIAIMAVDTDTSKVIDAANAVKVDVRVDTTTPEIGAERPSLVQLQALAKRVGKAKAQLAKWQQQLRRRGHGGKGQRHGNRWDKRDYTEWINLWLAQQSRLPVNFTLAESGTVEVTTSVGTRASTVETYRDAGRHTLQIALPTYTPRAKATITFAVSDDAGNRRQHAIVVTLPPLPAAPKPRSDTGGAPTTPTTPTAAIPTSGGPFPEWLNPIMQRATIGAGVPAAWAKSTALAKLVQNESSFRPTAQNPTSTAYGLFQFLDQTWATVGCTKTADAYKQSVCGLRYIQRRYRTPERAWAFWQAQSPHWY